MAGIAVELVRRMAERWNVGDLDATVAVCDPDVAVRPDSGVAVIEGFPTGVAGARQLFQSLRDAIGTGQVSVLEADDFASWGRPAHPPGHPLSARRRVPVGLDGDRNGPRRGGRQARVLR